MRTGRLQRDTHEYHATVQRIRALGTEIVRRGRAAPVEGDEGGHLTNEDDIEELIGRE